LSKIGTAMIAVPREPCLPPVEPPIWGVYKQESHLQESDNAQSAYADLRGRAGLKRPGWLSECVIV